MKNQYSRMDNICPKEPKKLWIPDRIDLYLEDGTVYHVRSFFAGRLFDLLKSHELPASESRVLLALLTDLAAPDLPLRKSLLDSIVETALSLLSQPDKLPLIAQLLQLAHALYALHTEPWMLQHFVVLFHAFANAAAATAERAAFVLSAFVELAPNKDGMVHISKLSDKRVAKVEDVVNIGDTVRVMETRPLSKDKRWRLVEVVERVK